MVDLDRVIARLLSSGAAAGATGGLVAAALTSRAGRKLGKKALQVGGVAAIAALAYTAYERHRRGRDASLAGGPSLAFLPPAADPEPRRALGLALVRTMIAAARADGRLDAAGNRHSDRRVAVLHSSAACGSRGVPDNPRERPDSATTLLRNHPQLRAIQLPAESGTLHGLPETARGGSSRRRGRPIQARLRSRSIRSRV